MRKLAIVAVLVVALGVVGAAAAKPTGPLNTPYRSDPVAGSVQHEQVGTSPAGPSSDFGWGDASIGAGVLLGVLALAATGVAGIRHNGRLGTS